RKVGRFARDGHHLLGMRIRQRIQQHAVHDAENRRVRSNSERQRQYRNRRKSRRLRQHPQRISNILHQRVHVSPRALRLSPPVHVAQASACAPFPCVLWSTAPRRRFDSRFWFFVFVLSFADRWPLITPHCLRTPLRVPHP